MKKRIALITAGLGLGALGILSATGGSAASAPPIPNHRTELAHILPGAHPNAVVYSNNWSGAAATGDTFRYVTASYSVPSVNCATTPSAFAYQWVGLDGFNSSSVEQDGVAGYCSNGSPTYFAWSEMYPANVVVQFYLNPGDAIKSNVYYSGSGNYTLSLKDLTSGQSFSQSATCTTCLRNSAEVITEGYPSSPYNGLADFGAENYDGIGITDSAGNKAGFYPSTHWSYTKIIQQGASGIDSSPSTIYGGKAFTNTWYRQN
jgi:hypothetical protein